MMNCLYSVLPGKLEVITGRMFEKKLTSYSFSTKISVNLYQKGWQFSCHLIIGRNVKDLSLENVDLILF